MFRAFIIIFELFGIFIDFFAIGLGNLRNIPTINAFEGFSLLWLLKNIVLLKKSPFGISEFDVICVYFSWRSKIKLIVIFINCVELLAHINN